MAKKELTWNECYGLANEMFMRLHKVLRCATTEPIYVYGIPRGGIPVAMMFVQVCRLKDIDCTIVNDAKEADVIVDDLIDSGKTMRKWRVLYPGKVFDVLITKEKSGNDWIVFPWEKGTEETGPEENVRRLIEFIGDDANREGLVETPKRVLKSYEKLFSGYKQDPMSVMKVFTEGACDGIVLLKNIEFYSTCEHHMLPFHGRCHIAYIPNGKVIGVSKLARLMEIFSRRLQIQERIGEQITGALEAGLHPLGAACIIEAQHFCMTSRGVEKQNSIMTTSSLTGIFRQDYNARQELMNLIKN